ncbi:hypothetical protein BSKO_08902 [Bryopsis sp. KO-2023]|nr:hypothetical protein BSKO_08902 [Bryopsis sp. KO-2023]
MGFWGILVMGLCLALLEEVSRVDAEETQSNLEGNLEVASGRGLRSYGSIHDRYEWGKEYHVHLEEGYQKGICFERGSTSCVQYSFFSSAPLLAFVANREFTAQSLKGNQEVGYVGGSDCQGTNCTAIKVGVSDKHSYCLVILNRENRIPDFSPPANSIVDLTFQVNGCPSTFWTIVSIVIVIVIMISIIACCVGVCIHMQKTKNSRRQAIRHHQAQHIAHIQMGGPNPGNMVVEPSPPQHRIHFMEAKI